MKFRSILLSLGIAVFASVAWWQAARAQTPSDQVDDVIRVESDLTSLLFTATDRNKKFITTLQESDLHLAEDNALQKIVSFQRETDRPLALAFLAQEVVTKAVADETVIYAIGIGDSKADGVDKWTLEQVAESTGGRAFFPGVRSCHCLR